VLHLSPTALEEYRNFLIVSCNLQARHLSAPSAFSV